VVHCFVILVTGQGAKGIKLKIKNWKLEMNPDAHREEIKNECCLVQSLLFLIRYFVISYSLFTPA
jgi:hypothetical protein